MNTKKSVLVSNIQKLFSKNKIGFPFFLVISFILYSFVILKDNTSSNENFLPDKKDSIATNQPKIDIKVNKKYDESGNLIQYDSSYSIIYSSPNANIQFFNFDNDSLLSHFYDKMNGNNFFNSNDFFQDFQLYGFNDDFFQMDPMLNFKQIEEMMDKIRGKTFSQPDSNFFQPQQNNRLQQNSSIPNMITL